MKSNADRSTGILLLNLGGPDSLSAVKPFLFNLFSDREIIRLGPSFLQKPIAWLISSLRERKTEKAYSLIGGKSPIREITSAQAEALEVELNGPSLSFGVYVAMRYWPPLIEDVVPEIHRDGISRLIVLNLYPQYSVATTGSTLAKLGEVISQYPIETFSIRSWYDNQLYIDALVDAIRKGLDVFGPSPEVHLLFSAHSLPVKFIEEGDPYAEQIQATIDRVVAEFGMGWSLSYQSKSGPVRWLGPSTDAMLEELASKGTKDVLVIPISFVSDHIETLYEIDILYKKRAEKLGMRLERTASLNTSPLFISALRDIVLKGMKEAGWAG